MFKKILLPTLVISGTIFTSFMLLLALQGSKPAKIQVDGQEVFYGEVKDIISPGVGAVFSLGLGLSTAVLWGWQKSVRQSSELEKQLSNLQKLVSEKESQIQSLKLSPSNPMLSQLRWFLDEDVSETQASKSSTNTISHKQSTQPVSTKSGEEVTTAQTMTKPLVITNTEFESKPITVNQLSVQTAASAFPSAQSAMGLTQRYNRQADG